MAGDQVGQVVLVVPAQGRPVGDAAADDRFALVHLAGEPCVEQHADAAHDDVGAAVHPGRVRLAVDRADLGVEQGFGRVRVDGTVDLAHEVAGRGGRVVGGSSGALEAGKSPAYAGVVAHQADQMVH